MLCITKSLVISRWLSGAVNHFFNNMNKVEFKQIEKIYPNGYQAIESFNLDIAAGELMVFVGPSGCGKSTLLRLLAGLEEISAGEICIDGCAVNQLSPQKRNIAMVFQDYALYPNMTVRGNLAFPLKMQKLSKQAIREKIEETAKMLDLSPFLDVYPKHLSGGQKQRVAMGRAWVRKPSVFLMDEPLSNLDAKLRAQVRAEIADMQKRLGLTMIYVTHDQVEAMTLGDRIAVLNQGRLQQVASPQQLYDQPANTFVAGFIGHPPMNLFKARVYIDSKGLVQLDLFGKSLELTDIDLAEGSYIVGIRPEAIAPLAQEEKNKPTFIAIAERCEFLGHETLLHFHPQASGNPASLIARLSGAHDFKPNEKIALSIGQFCLFSEEGDRLIETIKCNEFA